MKVLISPGCGAGWSTWNCTELAYDERIIAAFEKGITKEEMENLCVALEYPKPYMGGFSTLKVVEIPKGARFRITEHDGSERVEILNLEDFLVAS